MMLEIIGFGTAGREPTAGRFTDVTTPATPTDGFIGYTQLVAGDMLIAKAVLPDSYVAGTPIRVRVVYGATVAGGGTMSATLDGVSLVADVSGNNTISVNMAHHNNDAAVALTVTAANSNKFLADSTFEVTNSSGIFDDGSDTDVTAAPGDVVFVQINRSDGDTEDLRIYTLELDWS